MLNIIRMSWEYKQQRLRNMVGANSHLCFQVCVCVTTRTKPKSDEEFNAIAKDHGVDTSYKDYFKLPKKNYIEEMFTPGYFYRRNEYREIQTMEAEALYTTPLISSDNLDLDHSDALEQIVAKYVPAIEKSCSDLRFQGNNYADGLGISIEFRFFVQPYSLEICHPKDIDQLKPISIMGEKPIFPT